jgi:hypothetical protein
VLTIPRLAIGCSSTTFGFCTGPFGGGAYFANLRYTIDKANHDVPRPPDLAPGTIQDWQISEALEATEWQPDTLPELGALTSQSMHTEPWKKCEETALGLVLINRIVVVQRSPAAHVDAGADPRKPIRVTPKGGPFEFRRF